MVQVDPAKLLDLADRVQRLTFNGRQFERYMLDKDEIRRELQAMAQGVGKRLRGRAGVELRKRRLSAEPLCRRCKERGLVTLSTVPDHIKPLAQGGEDVDTNIRCLCTPCHDEVTREQFGQRARRATIGLDGWPA